jgi:hypothetical protein
MLDLLEMSDTSFQACVLSRQVVSLEPSSFDKENFVVLTSH